MGKTLSKSKATLLLLPISWTVVRARYRSRSAMGGRRKVLGERYGSQKSLRH